MAPRMPVIIEDVEYFEVYRQIEGANATAVLPWGIYGVYRMVRV